MTIEEMICECESISELRETIDLCELRIQTLELRTWCTKCARPKTDCACPTPDCPGQVMFDL